MQSGVKIGIAVVLLIAVSAAGYIGFIQYNKNKSAASAPAVAAPGAPVPVAKAEPKKNQLDRKDKPKAKPKEISTPVDKAEPKSSDIALAKPIVPAVIKPDTASDVKVDVKSDVTSKPSSDLSLAKVDPSKDVDWSKSDKPAEPIVPVMVSVKPSEPAKTDTSAKVETLEVKPLPSKSSDVIVPIVPGMSKSNNVKVADTTAITPAKTGESVRAVAQVRMTDPNDDIVVPVKVDRPKPAPAPVVSPKPVTPVENATPGSTEETIRVDVIRPGAGTPVKKDEPVGVGAPPVGPTANEEYSIQSGDTLTSIAQKKYGDAKHVATILKANPSLDPKRLKIGQKLVLPALNKPAPTGPVVAAPTDGGPITNAAGQSTYAVKSGDSFWTISEKVYGSGKYSNLIKEANPKVDSGSLKVGQQLIIPPKPVSATTQPAGAGAVVPVGVPTSRPVGFAGGASMPDPVLKAGEEVYVVQPGDSGFWGIAQKKYGDANLLSAIAKANPSVDASRLRVGQKLVIPSLEDARKLVGGAATRPASATSRPSPVTPSRVRTPATPAPARTPSGPGPADDGKPRFD